MILSVLGFFISMILFVFLSMKKWNVALVSIFASFILMCFNGINPLIGFSGAFSDGLSGFVGKWWLMFILGSVFGKIMQDTGLSVLIATLLISRVQCNPILAVLIISLIMSYGGISTFVIAFTIYPIASELFQRADIETTIMPAVILFCPTTLAMTMLPGSPSVQNIIPTAYLGTNIYAAPLLGILASIITFSLGYRYLKRTANIKNNMPKYIPSEPHFNIIDFSCFLPCIILWVVALLLIQLNTDSQKAVELSLVCGIICAIAISGVKSNMLESLNNGVQSGLKTLIITSLIMGYGNLVKSMDSFVWVTDKLYSLFDNEIVSSIIAVNIIAALTGSSLTSLQILFDTFLDRIRISELPAENIHRIIAIASGGLDSMPYATGVVVANDLAHTEQSKTYKHIFITCALIPLLALVLTVAISYLL